MRYHYSDDGDRNCYLAGLYWVSGHEAGVFTVGFTYADAPYATISSSSNYYI